MGHEYRNAGRPDRSRAVLIRDAALARVGRTRRWVIAGAAALTAGFAALVSAVAPGRTLSHKESSGEAVASAGTGARTTASVNGASSAIPSMPAAASSSDLGLQAPSQAPSQDNSQPAQPSAPQQSQPAQSQTQSIPSQPPAAAPQSSGGGGGGGVVSGGS